MHTPNEDSNAIFKPFRATVSVHDDTVSRESILFNDTILAGSDWDDGDLVGIRQMSETVEAHDFGSQSGNTGKVPDNAKHLYPQNSKPTFLYLIKNSAGEPSVKLPEFEISINKQIAATFNFVPRSVVWVEPARKRDWTASHVEISFRDAYLSRSDMWKFTSQELVGKTVYLGQKVSFLGSLKATIKKIHVQNQHSQSAFFDASTVPVFRSEAARYVIFIQMSHEMWDFDSEGGGEILFNRVVNGFLPELFKKWSEMDVRHLVSIVMFGRVEYRRVDATMDTTTFLAAPSSTVSGDQLHSHQDFYRVVVTDMASAQWTTILEVLKREFRVFLRDVSLFKHAYTAVDSDPSEEGRDHPPRITGRLSGALKGNILEAINLAVSQFSNDYIDRDLIRTGISVVIVTAGSGVFDVGAALLKLTSETLTNNGIGIDVVCLSKMPLHSVPLFRYRLQHSATHDDIHRTQESPSPSSLNTSAGPFMPDLSHSPAFSASKSSLNYFSRFPSAFSARLPQPFGYGIPQWIDLSYWSADMGYYKVKTRRRHGVSNPGTFQSGKLFKPRVRMYELQMMGLMEMGMADITIPYLNEKSINEDERLRRWSSQLSRSQYGRSPSQSPEFKRRSPSTVLRLQDKPQINRHHQDSGKGFAVFMDSYDSSAFTVKLKETKTRRRVNKRKVVEHGSKSTPAIDVPKVKLPLSTLQHQHASLRSNGDVDSRSDTESLISSASKFTRPRAPRNISYTLRGLAPLKASAVTPELRVENINALSSRGISGVLEHLESDSDLASSTNKPPQSRDHTRLKSAASPSSNTASKDEEGSKPIKIKSAAGPVRAGSLVRNQLDSTAPVLHDATLLLSDVAILLPELC